MSGCGANSDCESQNRYFESGHTLGFMSKWQMGQCFHSADRTRLAWQTLWNLYEMFSNSRHAGVKWNISPVVVMGALHSQITKLYDLWANVFIPVPYGHNRRRCEKSAINIYGECILSVHLLWKALIMLRAWERHAPTLPTFLPPYAQPNTGENGCECWKRQFILSVSRLLICCLLKSSFFLWLTTGRCLCEILMLTCVCRPLVQVLHGWLLWP